VGGANNDSPDHITLLDRATRDSPFYGSDDNVTQPSILPPRATEQANTHYLSGTGIIRYLESSVGLNHVAPSGLGYFFRLDLDYLAFGDNLGHPPVLLFGEGSGFHNPDNVTLAALFLLIVGLVFARLLYAFLIQRMTLDSLNSDYHCLIHLVTDYPTNPGFTLRFHLFST
jgi:hypothetical protein